METVELDVPSYSFCSDGKNIDKPIYEILNKYKYLENSNKKLMEENKRLKSEHYKDEELSTLKKQIDEQNEKLVNSFVLSKEEVGKIQEWMKNHECTHQGMKIKGVSEYIFRTIPGIGYNGYAKCSCGKEFCFYEE